MPGTPAPRSSATSSNAANHRAEVTESRRSVTSAKGGPLRRESVVPVECGTKPHSRRRVRDETLLSTKARRNKAEPSSLPGGWGRRGGLGYVGRAKVMLSARIHRGVCSR